MTAQKFLILDADGNVKGTGSTPDGTIPQSAVACTEEQAAAWHELRVVGGQIVQLDGAVMLDRLKKKLIAAATARRWAVETGGITLPNGVRVSTGKDDQDRITSVLVNAQAAGVESIEFKATSGWVSLTLPELQVIANAIALHVQACFSAERAHHDAIAALSTSAAVQTYDLSAGWPQASLAALPEA